MERIKSLLSVRFAALAALVVLLLAGVTFAVMSYGPSEAERAYALACEAIRVESGETIAFPGMDSDMVEVVRNPGGITYSFLIHVNGKKWAVFINSKGRGLAVDKAFVTNFPQPHI